MGGVLATIMSLEYKAYIDRLILVNPALEYLRMQNGKLKIILSLRQGLKILSDKENKEHSSKIRRCSISSIREFCSLVKEHRGDIEKVNCPILILHGKKDYVVPIEQIENIYKTIENKNKQFIVIENGSHWILARPLDSDVVKKIEKFLLITNK